METQKGTSGETRKRHARFPEAARYLMEQQPQLLPNSPIMHLVAMAVSMTSSRIKKTLPKQPGLPAYTFEQYCMNKPKEDTDNNDTNDATDNYNTDNIYYGYNDWQAFCTAVTDLHGRAKCTLEGGLYFGRKLIPKDAQDKWDAHSGHLLRLLRPHIPQTSNFPSNFSRLAFAAFTAKLKQIFDNYLYVAWATSAKRSSESGSDPSIATCQLHMPAQEGADMTLEIVVSSSVREAFEKAEGDEVLLMDILGSFLAKGMASSQHALEELRTGGASKHTVSLVRYDDDYKLTVILGFNAGNYIFQHVFFE